MYLHFRIRRLEFVTTFRALQMTDVRILGSWYNDPIET
jgi:hypothetical protein